MVRGMGIVAGTLLNARPGNIATPFGIVWGKMIKRYAIIWAALLGACSSGSPTAQHCTRPDVEGVCIQRDTIIKNGNTWEVRVNKIRTVNEGYTDDGFVCSRKVTTCTPTVCLFSGVPASWTDAFARAECRGD